MDSDGQMVNGDISPSLMVLFKLQRCHKNLVVQRHLGEIAENKRDFYLGDKTSVLTFDINFHKSVHMYGNRFFYKISTYIKHVRKLFAMSRPRKIYP